MSYGIRVYNSSGILRLQLDDKIYKLVQAGTINLIQGTISVPVTYPYALSSPVMVLTNSSLYALSIVYANSTFTIYSSSAKNGVPYEIYSL